MALAHDELEGGSGRVGDVVQVEECLDVPAGHQPVLRRDGDDPGAFVGVLAVCGQPGDGLGVVASDVLDGHGVLGVEVLAVQDLEGAVVEGDAYLAVGVDAHLNTPDRTFLMFFCSISFSLICLMWSVR